jgi:adenine phosphoribosyltransferase/phosphomevalonate kinase
MSFKVVCFSTTGAHDFIEQLRSKTNGWQVYSSTATPFSAPEMFDQEPYMHFNPSCTLGREPIGKLQSFKRCVLLQSSWNEAGASELLRCEALAPTKVCYIHIVHCGGVAQTPNDLACFAHRNWEFGAVITGQWETNNDPSEAARVREWVHETCKRLLCQPAMGVGIYTADLGPDDAAYALHAFGDHARQLFILKSKLDPHRVLRHTCPLPPLFGGMVPMLPPTISANNNLRSRPVCAIIISGRRGVGKDFVASHVATLLEQSAHEQARPLTVHVASISETFKRRFCLRTGVHFDRLQSDREYKEQHRLALQDAYDQEKAQCPNYNLQSFMECVEACGTEVLIVTGMREGNLRFTTSAAGVAAITVLVKSSHARVHMSTADTHATETSLDLEDFDLQFDNTTDGAENIQTFVRSTLSAHVMALFIEPTWSPLVRSIPTIEGWPTKGIRFRDVLALYQQPLALNAASARLCRAIQRLGVKIDVLVSPESSGLVLAGSLSDRLGVGVVQVRKDGAKLPPPRRTERCDASFIASQASIYESEKEEQFPSRTPHTLNVRLGNLSGCRCIIVDDTLASGDTACAVARLLVADGAQPMGLACLVELPRHGGRTRLAVENIPTLSVLAFDGL